MEPIPPNETFDDFHAAADPGRSVRGRSSYPLQSLAHGYFLCSGLWLWCRWAFRQLFCLGPGDTSRERASLVRRFQVYLGLLERWGIIELEFLGFEDAGSWSGSLIAPNHPSILDVLLVMSRVPSLDCVMNAHLLRNPVTAGGAHLCNFIQNDSLRPMIKVCRENLEKGSNILIFPEGTRTVTPPLGPFHHIYALAAKSANAPIRTILIECDSDYFGRKFSYFKPARCPMRFRLTAGRVFQCTPTTTPRTLSAEIEAYFRSQLSGEV
jgi:1-acyl-sn-glycerol-3-phosphate acyltransferase